MWYAGLVGDTGGASPRKSGAVTAMSGGAASGGTQGAWLTFARPLRVPMLSAFCESMENVAPASMERSSAASAGTPKLAIEAPSATRPSTPRNRGTHRDDAVSVQTPVWQVEPVGHVGRPVPHCWQTSLPSNT